VLDLGCATGAFITAHLAARFAVTGVDISPVQLEQARTAIPNARFIQADMTRLQFPPASFDAVVAFYSLNHLPRETLPALLRAIAGWLRPGGLFVAAFPTRDDPGTVEPAWLGVPMFFSGFDAATNERLVRDAGLVIEQVCREPIDEAGSAAVFLWIVAQTPARR
jgi:SAM-dependent methyltransferase